MSAIISNQFRIQNLLAFQAAIANTGSNSFYLCISKFLPWGNETSPDTPVDSEKIARALWDSAIAGKQVLSTNTRQGIFLRPWVSGQYYDMYRDDYDGTIVTVNLDGSVRSVNPPTLFDTYFYVINPANLNVYKCLYNRSHTTNLQVPSTDSSFLTDTSSNVVHASDGYDWKYMFTVSSSDAALFNTPSFVPASVTGANALVAGGLYEAVVTAAGTGYTSAPTVTVYGDGTGATATATLSGTGVVYVQMTAPGSGYSHASLVFSGGSGSGATARAIISPIGGHASEPANELGGTYLIVQQKFIANESASGSKFTVANDYRQIFLLKNPTKSSVLVTSTTIQICGQLTLSAFPASFIADASLTGNTSGAKGNVIDFISPIVRFAYDYTQTGTALGKKYQANETITDGTNVGTVATAGVIAPDVDAYTGNVIYFENRQYITRSISQTEDVRLIVEF